MTTLYPRIGPTPSSDYEIQRCRHDESSDHWYEAMHSPIVLVCRDGATMLTNSLRQSYWIVGSNPPPFPLAPVGASDRKSHSAASPSAVESRSSRSASIFPPNSRMVSFTRPGEESCPLALTGSRNTYEPGSTAFSSSMTALKSLRWRRSRCTLFLHKEDEEPGRLCAAGILRDGVNVLRRFIERPAGAKRCFLESSSR
jgi:hypothetical protein